jgi:hypothetical protein
VSADIDRPRPAYGEYATPEQVARARGMSLEEYERHLEAITSPPRELPTDRDSTSDASAPAERPARAARQDARSAGSAANRVATIALLAFGLVSVLTSIPQLLNLGAGIQGTFADQGIEPYTSFALARTLGLVGIVVQLLLWLLALAASVTALRQGRVSWWIPLVAGVIAVIVVGALGVAAILADPAFSAYLASLSPGR